MTSHIFGDNSTELVSLVNWKEPFVESQVLLALAQILTFVRVFYGRTVEVQE